MPSSVVYQFRSIAKTWTFEHRVLVGPLPRMYLIKAIAFPRYCLSYKFPFPKMTPSLSIVEMDLSRLKSNIRESERALDVMYDRAASLEKQLWGSENTHSDISILPVEVLGMIFGEVIGRSDACMGYQSSFLGPDELAGPTVRPELRISHVSKYWREVAIELPSLWTRIRLYVKQSSNLVNLYLSRSRGLPLTIAFRQHFVCGTHPRLAYPEDYPRIVSTILDHMHVCRRLEIRTNVSVPELLHGLGHSRAPLLEEIVLYHPCRGMREPTFSTSLLPRLTRLELGELVSVSTSMPTGTLTSLTLAGLPALGLSAPIFLSLLSRLKSLSHLALLDEAVDFNRLQTTDFVEVPSLRSWTLKPGPGTSQTYLTGLMQTVFVPALKELILDFTDIISSKEIQLFLRYLKRQAPLFLSLYHITIDSPFDGFDILSAFVHAAPSIQSLSLSRYNVDSVLVYLSHDARREAFPKLCTLKFKSPHFDWDVVLSFLQKRKQLGRPLRSLKFQGFGGSKGKVLDELFGKLLEACLAV